LLQVTIARYISSAGRSFGTSGGVWGLEDSAPQNMVDLFSHPTVKNVCGEGKKTVMALS